ncbi:MAG: DMT family transporter, partial [Geminicoccaceae bacterium]
MIERRRPRRSSGTDQDTRAPAASDRRSRKNRVAGVAGAVLHFGQICWSTPPMPNPPMSPAEWLLLVALSLLWGGAFFLTELALRELPPLTLVLGRTSLAALALVALVHLVGLRMPRGARVWLAFLIMGALNNALPFSLIAFGQTEITGGHAAILISTSPLFSLGLGHFLTGHERISASRLAGLVLGVAGVAMLVGPDALGGLGAKGAGQVAVLGAAFCYAYAAIFGRRFHDRSPLIVAAGQLS